MRFERLLLSRYGHFTDFCLDFGEKPDGTPDLHVLFGPNEAGKSTTLAAMTDVLYGIERTTPWKFLHGNELLELQATLRQAERCVELKRFKRHWTNHLDEKLDRFPLDLQGLSREDYQRRFSFDEQTLQAGGEQILSSAGDVGQALFSASSGLADLKENIESAMQSANGFWQPGKRKGLRITELKGALLENKRQMDAVKLDIPAWKKRRSELDHATLRRDRHRQTRDTLQQAIRQLERRQSATTLARGARKLAGQIQTLEETRPIVPETHALADELTGANASREFVSRTQDKLQDCNRARETAANLGSRLHELQLRIEESKPDDHSRELLRAEERLRHLAEQGSAMLAWKQQQSEHQASIEASEAEIDSLRERLGVASEVALEPLLPGESQLGQWQEQLDEEGSLSAAVKHAMAELERLDPLPDDRLEHDASIDKAHENAAQTDSEMALELLHGVQQSGTVSQHQRAVRDLIEAQQAFDTLLEKTGLSQDAFTQLDPPDKGWLNASLEEWSELCKQRDQGTDQLEQLAASISDIDSQCQSLTLAGAVDADLLQRLLSERDDAWSEHRSQIEQARDTTELLHSANRFEQSLHRHDQLQQQGLSNAQASSELQVLQRQRQELLSRQSRIEGELAAQEKKLQLRSRSLLARVEGFYPETGIDVEALRNRHDLIISLQEKLEQTHACQLQLKSLEHTVNEKRERILHVLDPLFDTARQQTFARLSLEDLLAQATRLVESHRAELARAEEQARTIRALRKEHDSRTEQLAMARQQLSDWQSHWQDSTCDTLLAGKSLIQARDALSWLSRLAPLVQRRAESIRIGNELGQRIETHRTDTAELLKQLKVSTLDEALEQLNTARLQLDRHGELQTELTGLEKQLQENTAQHAHSMEIIETLKTELNAESDAALNVLLNNTLEHRELRERHQLALSELQEVSGEKLDEASIQALGEDSAADEIAQELAALRDQLLDVEKSLDAASEDWALANHAVEELGDDNQFAWLDMQRQNLLLQLGDEARQCAVSRAGQKVLEAAIKRFRLEHQSGILSEAQQAFATLTGGRYEQLLPREDEKGREQLYVVAGNGQSRAVTELSTGTRYQLYLALRAAAYADYAAQRSPLPFVADDIMESFDDERAAAAFQVLAGMADKGQVIYLTHHRHLLDLAREVIGPDRLRIHHYP